MLEPIGMIGYTCPVVVIDETGLVSPEVAKRRLQGDGWYSDLVNQRRPAWLIVRQSVFGTMEAFAGRGRPFRSAAERDGLLTHYRLAARAGPEEDPNGLVLLQRVN
jgi:hypothetical protein